MACYPAVEWEVFEHFPRRTPRNRYDILSPQGRLSLTIPVERPNGSKTLTKDILIADQGNWRTDHLRSLQACYRSSPYFDHYESEIAQLLLHESHGPLVDYAKKTTGWLLSQFGIGTEIKPSTVFHSEQATLLTNDRAYHQVFFGQTSFTNNLSTIDLLFNTGPAGSLLLKKCKETWEV